MGKKVGEVKPKTGLGKEISPGLWLLSHVLFSESLCARFSWEAARPWTKGVPIDHTSAELPV